MHGESSPSDKADSNASKQVRAIAPSPSHDTSITDSSPCGTLKKFPVEVRFMIYRKVLEYNKHINRPHRFLGPQPPMIAGTSKYIEAIDATLLRTCKAIYREATCVLYRNNFFYFKRPSDIKAFAHFGLDTTPFGCYNNAPSGRLTLIRHLNLKLGAENKEDDFTKTWSFWSNFFYPLDELDQSIRFPALVGLNLNLTDWKLESGDASKLRVKPFLRKLRPKGGLRHLTLLGVVHEQNLRDFKHGFVREGGTFRPASISAVDVATATVSHDDLPEVSMFVRAIVEEDKASRTVMQNKKNAGTSDSK